MVMLKGEDVSQFCCEFLSVVSAVCLPCTSLQKPDCIPTVVVFVSMKDFNLSILYEGIFLQKPHAELEVELARKIRKEAVIVFGLY